MTYRVEISSVAEAEADSAYLRMAQVTSLESASRWYRGLLETIASLAEMPKRCPLARENSYFSKEIRQSLYGKKRNTYRILFTVVEDENLPTVRILHIRSATQQTLGENQEAGNT